MFIFQGKFYFLVNLIYVYVFCTCEALIGSFAFATFILFVNEQLGKVFLHLSHRKETDLKLLYVRVKPFEPNSILSP